MVSEEEIRNAAERLGVTRRAILLRLEAGRPDALTAPKRQGLAPGMRFNGDGKERRAEWADQIDEAQSAVLDAIASGLRSEGRIARRAMTRHRIHETRVFRALRQLVNDGRVVREETGKRGPHPRFAYHLASERKRA